MTRKEFIDMVDRGGDIMFDCGNKHFTICAWSDNPIDIAEQETEDNQAEFNSAEELLTGYIVNGIPLGNQIDHIVITFRS